MYFHVLISYYTFERESHYNTSPIVHLTNLEIKKSNIVLNNLLWLKMSE